MIERRKTAIGLNFHNSEHDDRERQYYQENFHWLLRSFRRAFPSPFSVFRGDLSIRQIAPRFYAPFSPTLRNECRGARAIVRNPKNQPLFRTEAQKLWPHRIWNGNYLEGAVLVKK